MIYAMNDFIRRPEFKNWIENSLADGANILARSNQGTILLYRNDDVECVVKCAMGGSVAHGLRQRTLLREFEAYQKMAGLDGIPKCPGMVDQCYLVLEYIHGVPFREAQWSDREAWFEGMLGVIRSFHERGVSHGDLKSKSNILVTHSQQPCVIDFGTAFVQRKGFHPINNRIFEYGKRLDLNAWVKHKYHGRYSEASDEDRKLLDYSLLERVVRKFSGRPLR
jgi:predicted Ser/Thr protein kinase